jgi:ribosomal protein L35
MEKGKQNGGKLLKLRRTHGCANKNNNNNNNNNNNMIVNAGYVSNMKKLFTS